MSGKSDTGNSWVATKVVGGSVTGPCLTNGSGLSWLVKESEGRGLSLGALRVILLFLRTLPFGVWVSTDLGSSCGLITVPSTFISRIHTRHQVTVPLLQQLCVCDHSKTSFWFGISSLSSIRGLWQQFIGGDKEFLCVTCAPCWVWLVSRHCVMEYLCKSAELNIRRYSYSWSSPWFARHVRPLH